MRVAIVHDWLTVYGGAEKVLEQIILLYPDADIFSLVDFLPDDQRDLIKGKPVQTSFVQRLPFARRKYRLYLPLMPLAVEQFDLSGYDLVISSSYAVAKGVLTGPDQLHLCMCHSPIRYAWDLQHQYLKETGLNKGLKGLLAKWMLHKIRLWDYRTSDGVNGFIANSEFISRRIWKVYRRESTLIYPPVDVSAFTYHAEKEDYYLTASRMVPYKRIDLIVEAFSRLPDKKLVVIGDGPEFDKIRAKAGNNVLMLGYQPFEALKEKMQRAKAFIFAAEEDFGIVPVEAQACGTPVIAFGKGGALETVRGLDSHAPTGVFFEEQTVSSLVASILRFEDRLDDIAPQACRENALRFSKERFQYEFRQYVSEQLKLFDSDWNKQNNKREVI
ncbi:glycosyltransferase family 4 protein [Cohnella endophytica]|uniref:Glycosyltransferase family 4 protein n=1 Tax=Cohnella endophytica TaxID=2419778 RepID=A0A494XYN1_9BACL|nr:glycosyltransferase family 4 protein [Cohnella endophytica]RKP53189.1 glycosyltransferase family 4 protein [Cohnella endophytica]